MIQSIVDMDVKVAGIVIDYSSLLASMAAAAAGKTPEQIERLVLGNLSPASPLDCEVHGCQYPDSFGADELLRCDAVHQLAESTHQREYTPLSGLLEMRIGTPETYSITLAVLLKTVGVPCEICITGPDADPRKYAFVRRGEQQVDLFGDAVGFRPRRLRANKTFCL